MTQEKTLNKLWGFNVILWLKHQLLLYLIICNPREYVIPKISKYGWEYARNMLMVQKIEMVASYITIINVWIKHNNSLRISHPNRITQSPIHEYHLHNNNSNLIAKHVCMQCINSSTLYACGTNLDIRGMLLI